MKKKSTFTIPVDFDVIQTIHLRGEISVEADSQEEAINIINERKQDSQFIQDSLFCDDYDWEFSMNEVRESVDNGKVVNIRPDPTQIK